jgi:hypothetical protein
MRGGRGCGVEAEEERGQPIEIRRAHGVKLVPVSSLRPVRVTFDTAFPTAITCNTMVLLIRLLLPMPVRA